MRIVELILDEQQMASGIDAISIVEAPAIESNFVALKSHEVKFAKVDTEAEQQLGGSLGIQSIPTIMAFRDGVLLFSQPGALPAASLDKLIASVREVDMVEVHKQIAEQETT